MIAAFLTAPAGERLLTAGDYLVGAIELVAVAAALSFGAYRVRMLILPGWSGAAARLAEIVLGVVGLIWISEALGTFGWFTEGAVLAAMIVLGAGAGLAAMAIGDRRPARLAPGPPAPGSWGLAKLVAVGVCAALAAGWMVPTLGTLAAGMDRTDSLWYHMPLAARFVQTGYLGHIYFFDPIFLASFYPANSEVVHAVPLLFFHRDILSPVINLGWLAVALLGAWCIGRPYGLGPQALIGASIALGSQSLVEFQAGEALNDITGVAFTLAAAGLLVNGYAMRRPAGIPLGQLAGIRPRDPYVGRAAGIRPRGPAGLPGHASRMSLQTGGPRMPDTGVPAAAGVGPWIPRAGEQVVPTSLSARTVEPGRGIHGPALVIAGLAAGLAAGTKLSFLAPIAALTVGVILIAPRGARLRAAGLWIVPTLAAGGYWYLRNLIAVGNPIPYISSIGPISLPAPVRDFHLRPDFAVVHYWKDTTVWREWFFPGLHESFGTLWPATIIGMLAVGIFALWRGREPILRVLGAFVLVTAVAYVFTPLTAAGEQGQPISFVWNVRYLAPAIAVGLAILPCLPELRATPGRRAAVLAALGLVVAFTLGSLVQWKQGHTKGAVAAGVAVVVVAAAIAAARSRGHLRGATGLRARVAIAAVVLAIAAVAGYAEERHYLTHRYENTGQIQDLAGALRWSRDIRDARIAVAGIRGVFTQYPFYGSDLSNQVQWLGVRGPHDSYGRIANCFRWRQAVDDGGYTHVVTTFDPYLPGTLRNSPEGRWTQSDPNAKAVIKDGPVRVFRITGPLDPARCGAQRPLTAAQLHSVPNLNGTATGTR